jgi:hypothetical protein
LENPTTGLGALVAEALFRTTNDGYLATFVDCETEFLVERLRWDHDELFGILSVACGLAGAKGWEGSISAGTFNFSSTRVRRERAKELAERARAGGKLDFILMLEEVCQRVLKAERQGAPAVILRNVPRPNPEVEYDVDGFRFTKDHETIEFGDGGTAKSYHLLYTGGVLAQRGLRVALFDWELTAGEHRLRLERIFGADMPDVRYVKCDRPLIYEIDRLRKIVRAERLDFALFDSIGYACPGPPEAAEHAMSYNRAVRQLGIGSLHVAHVRQGENNDLRPFGSSFWHNSARSTWFVKLAATSNDGQRITIGLFNRKANLSALRPAVGFEISFDHDRTSFQRVNVADVTELAESLPLWQRMKQAVSHEPKTLARLADELGATVETLDRTVRRKNGLFTRVPNTDGVTRIALVESRVA